MRQIKRMALVAAACFAFAPRAGAQEYAVVVNEAVPATRLAASELGRIFEKRATRWPNGLEAEPVDLGADSPVRERFSLDVLGKSVAQTQAFWQAQLFSGRAVPPVELGSDALVLQYVQTHAGAVGYVSKAARLPEGVRRLSVSL